LYGHVAHLGVDVIHERAAIVALLAIALVLALKLPDRWITRADTGLRFLAVALIAVTLWNIIPSEVADATTPRTIVAGGRTLPSTTTAQKRDVYWLIFDRYGSDRALDIAYGAQSDLEPWLSGQGFTVLDGSH